MSDWNMNIFFSRSFGINQVWIKICESSLFPVLTELLIVLLSKFAL